MKNLEKWQKTFIKISFGQSVSLITSSIVQYAIIWYITYKTQSAFWLSIASIVAFVPQGLLGIFIGSYIDKRNRKKIMIYSDLFIALISMIMVIYGLYTNLPIWLILICLAFRSIGAAFYAPSLQASIPLIVPENSLLKYSGYSQSLQSISLIISPAIAALIYGNINISLIIFIDVIGAVVAILTLIISEVPNLKSDNQEKIYYLKEIKEGINIIVKNKVIKYLFFISAFFILLFMPIGTLFPLMTISYFGKDTLYVGGVETVYAVGMLIGGIILAKSNFFQDKRKNIIISILIMGITTAVSGIISKEMFYVFAILTLLMGFSGPIFQATISTAFAEQIPPEFLGRLYSNYISLSVLVMPLGLLISGLFADNVGINNWFLITGVLIIILSIYMMFNKISLKK